MINRRGARDGLVLVAVADRQPAAGLTSDRPEGDSGDVVQAVEACWYAQCMCLRQTPPIAKT